MKINKSETDVNVLFEALREAAQIICKEKELIFHCNADCTTAYTDGYVIEQIISNLLSNAERYAQSKVKLECICRNGHFTITVSDDGKGFSNEALRCAFDSYFTEESKTEGIHYGLGLAICKILCKKLDGRISCRNDSGAVVSVEI